VTAAALRRVAEILKDEAPGSVFRIAVNGGGCSGFQYEFVVATDVAEDDLKLGTVETPVVIDPVSLDYVKGSRVDFVDNLMGAAFKIENPNATASCGCGTSFAL
jgi:iron-sulfur cluster assembly accessory protein